MGSLSVARSSTGPARWEAVADGLIIAYLLAHGVIAMLIDCQSILPDVSPELFAAYEAVGLTAVVRRWGREQGDFLVLENPVWFKAFIYCEVRARAPLPDVRISRADLCSRAAHAASSARRGAR